MELSLYPVIDTVYLNNRNIEKKMEEVLLGGADIVQLRDKVGNARSFFQLAGRCKALTTNYDRPLIINDRLDIALGIDADGVHLGQEDLPVKTARRLLGPDKILGISVTTLAEALQAQDQGASYVSISPVFFTTSKHDIGDPAGLKTLKSIKEYLEIPVVGIGGISEENLAEVLAAGCDGVSLISAIFAHEDIKNTTQRLKMKITEFKAKGDKK